MTTEQFAHLSELVEDIKAMDDPAVAAMACRALNDLLHGDTIWKEEIEA